MSPKKTTVVPRKRVTIDELKKLVNAYQKATSIIEVAGHMGWKLEKVRTQATRLRKRGVPLREFPRQSKLSEADIIDLTGLCGGPVPEAK